MMNMKDRLSKLQRNLDYLNSSLERGKFTKDEYEDEVIQLFAEFHTQLIDDCIEVHAKTNPETARGILEAIYLTAKARLEPDIFEERYITPEQIDVK